MLAAEVHSLDEKLQGWKTTLPEWIQPSSPVAISYPWLHFSAQKLFWRYCNHRIILHRRAFLERALMGLPLTLDQDDTDPDSCLEVRSCTQCLESASETVRSIHDFFSSRPLTNRLEAWYGLCV